MSAFRRKIAFGIVALLAITVVVRSQTTETPKQQSKSTGAKANAGDSQTESSTANRKSDAPPQTNTKNKDSRTADDRSDRAQQEQLTELLSGYYGGYSDGYVDGLEDAVYYIIDLHHQGQDLQAQNSEVHNEQIQRHRDDLRKRMRDRRNGGHDSWVQSAGTRKLNGVVVDQWVTRHKGDKHQFIELETSPGVRFDVDLGSRQTLASTPIRDNERIAVRGAFHDPSAEHPTFVAQRVWIGDRPSIAVNGGTKTEQDARPQSTNQNVERASATQAAASLPAVAKRAFSADRSDQPSDRGHRTVTVQLGQGPRGRAFLGIQIDRRMENEVRVSHVYENSPAAKAGLRPGDIIAALNGQELNSPGDLTEDLNQLQANETIDLTVDRGHDDASAMNDANQGGRPKQGKNAAARSSDDTENR